MPRQRLRGILAVSLRGEAARLHPAVQRGSIHATALGFLAGALVYGAANVALTRHGAKHCNRGASKRATSGPRKQ